MKNTLFILVLLFISTTTFAQTVTQDHLKEIKKSYNGQNNYDKAITNAVSNNDIKKLALNRQNVSKYDHDFKYKVAVKGITNQEKSGRCWMFTSFNVLRPKVMANKEMGSFEFSTSYLYFWDIFEKSNLYLEGIIETRTKPIDDREVVWLFSSPVGDGGVWNSFVNLAGKYGAVPKSVMPETHSSENTRTMVMIIKRKLREDGVKLRAMATKKKSESDIRKEKIKMLGDIYKILAINLGEPPTEFNWRYTNKEGKLSVSKKYTPQSFLAETTGNINFDNYIMLMDDPTRPYNKLYEIQKDRNVMEGKNWRFINIPSAKIKDYALKSIQANEAMYFSCDVGKQLNSKEGLLSVDNYDYEALFGVEFGMDKKQRVLSRESGSSHGMALVAVDTDDKGKITKWQLENSWGATSGHNGYLTMTDEWFDQYMFRTVILKQFIDAETLKILEQKPTILPPWDPMFLQDN